jgi:hypothetical protein
MLTPGPLHRPSIGAYFASRSFPSTPSHTASSSSTGLNIYAVPALVSLVLLSIETIYLFFCLPETRGYKSRSNGSGATEEKEVKEVMVKRESVEVRQARLN